MQSYMALEGRNLIDLAGVVLGWHHINLLKIALRNIVLSRIKHIFLSSDNWKNLK